MSRVEALWELLKSEYGIETAEQFEEAYRKGPGIDITPFVSPREESGLPQISEKALA